MWMFVADWTRPVVLVSAPSTIGNHLLMMLPDSPPTASLREQSSLKAKPRLLKQYPNSIHFQLDQYSLHKVRTDPPSERRNQRGSHFVSLKRVGLEDFNIERSLIIAIMESGKTVVNLRLLNLQNVQSSIVVVLHAIIWLSSEG